MSCLGPKYLPVPPRLWSRVENPCAYTDSELIKNIPGDYIYLPYSTEPILKSQYEYQLRCLKKGNVLQYKKNCNLTKQQIYAQIAKNKWVNRTTTWATQTETSSNPNTKSLKRVNYYNITLDGTPTTAPLTCSLPPPRPPLNSNLPPRPTNVIPPAPLIPPPPPPNQPGSPVLPPYVPQPSKAPIVIPDSGNLVCNIVENICTGEILAETAVGRCFPTTASDVPGHIMLLCYNDSLPTVYPKTRLNYPTAGGKWPEGAKLILPAQT